MNQATNVDVGPVQYLMGRLEIGRVCDDEHGPMQVAVILLPMKGDGPKHGSTLNDWEAVHSVIQAMLAAALDSWGPPPSAIATHLRTNEDGDLEEYEPEQEPLQ